MNFRNTSISNHITMIDMVANMSFSNTHDTIYIWSGTLALDTPYSFTLAVNKIHPFNVLKFIGSLVNSNYTKLEKEMEA